MKETPILFKPPMVQAILAGNKTMTRRIVKPQPPSADFKMLQLAATTAREEKKHIDKFHWAMLNEHQQITQDQGIYFTCPYGFVGDRVWVRETWRYSGTSTQGNKHLAYVAYHADGAKREIAFDTFDKMFKAMPQQNLKYPADYDEYSKNHQQEIKYQLIDKWWDRQKKKPSIFMPRWASRITLEITGVRVERLQDISEDDAKAEGVTPSIVGDDLDGLKYRAAFQSLWNKINGAESWNVNPFVWVVEFKKL